MKKVILLVFLVSFMMVSCKKEYKKVIYYTSTEYRPYTSDSKFEAKNDSDAYHLAMFTLFMSRSHDRYNPPTDGSYQQVGFVLYDEDGNKVNPPAFTREDLLFLGQGADESEVVDQLVINTMLMNQ